MEKAALWWLAQAYRHIQCPDRQILLHPVADSPAHDAAAMQIEDDSEVEPSLRRPDIGDVAGPFTVGRIGGEIAVQPVCRDTQAMVAVCRNLVFARADRPDPVDVGYAALRVIRRSPTSSPTSFNSIVMRGRP